jgi:hypothetical protein
MGAANSCTIYNGQNQIANFNCNGAWHNTGKHDYMIVSPLIAFSVNRSLSVKGFSLHSADMLVECNSGGAPVEFGWIESGGYRGSASFSVGETSGFVLINDDIITDFWCNQD